MLLVGGLVAALLLSRVDLPTEQLVLVRLSPQAVRRHQELRLECVAAGGETSGATWTVAPLRGAGTTPRPITLRHRFLARNGPYECTVSGDPDASPQKRRMVLNGTPVTIPIE
jgi:hypothetical protein